MDVNLLLELFSSDFVPRGVCGEWHLFYQWLYIWSNLTIFLAYMAIPFALAACRFYSRPVGLSPKELINIRIAFALFIAFCGIGHLEGVIAFWHPYYHLMAVWDFLTAVVSWGACILFYRYREKLHIAHL